jgi:hypothetical protein
MNRGELRRERRMSLFRRFVDRVSRGGYIVCLSLGI